MRIVVDYDQCESNAICMQIAPDVFEVRDDDFLYVLDETPGPPCRRRSNAARSRRSRLRAEPGAELLPVDGPCPVPTCTGSR